jgi:hypothetical protein
MVRRLPTPAETAEILARRRTRPPRRPPPPAGKSLAPMLKALDERFGGSGAGPRVLRERWREIVGETLARRTEPVKLVRPRKGGAATLEVRVDGPAAALIQHQSADILARVNLTLGDGAVERLRISQGPLSAPKAAPPRRIKPPPLDAAVEADLSQSLAEAPDGLKAALMRLGREVLRRG